MAEEDRRALSPLFWTHVNPYGRFVLDMDSRLDLAVRPEAPQSARAASDAVTSGSI